MILQPLTIATWNVNSIRVRLPHVVQLLDTHQPDILALQETKVEDHLFPLQELEAQGYYSIFCGQKTYNGVALLRHTPWEDIHPHFEDPQCRILSASTLGVRVVVIYAPNGAHVDSDKYFYKLQWFEKLNAYLKQALQTHPYLVVLGDYNIAPTDQDVYDPVAWQGHILVSDSERAAFDKLLDLGLTDNFRLMNPSIPGYTWWDYRNGAFRRNKGLRIDHILSSSAMTSHCIRCTVDSSTRSLLRPSDHAPVIARYRFQ
jgi:exodeoxyribonuclease-3